MILRQEPETVFLNKQDGGKHDALRDRN
jgi:hypothetical protein